MEKKQLKTDLFNKIVKEVENLLSFVDGQKDNYVRMLADLCNKNGLDVDKAKIAIKEKFNFDDDLVTKIINQEYSNKKLFGIANKKTIEEYLKEKYTFRYNEVLGKVEYKKLESTVYELINDYVLNSIWRTLESLDYKITPGKLVNLLESDFVPKYNPFKEYFSNLPKWDGKDYIQEFSEMVNTDDPEFWKDALTRWVVAMVACSIEDKVTNQSVIVLNGGQGIGKSTFIGKILPPELCEYKYSGTINPDNKDTLILLSERILIDLDELGSLNRKDEKSMKELITKANIQIRKPYGKIVENLPRRASFIGSVNDGEFLMDMTGNRRFLCFKVSEINNTKIDYDKLYSQVMHLYKLGFKYWFDGDEIDMINEKNERFRSKDPIEELVLAEFQPCTEDLNCSFLSATEILKKMIDKYNIPMNNTSSMTIGKVMTGHGFRKVRKGNSYKYAVQEKVI
ncbi:virulence-associated e family protein [Elizabethkingia meningoseptica]|uniref:VapE domain-containing protein n=1 Tax=Elizabethkingia meningoseptica TaxID=238 RepID=UPI00099981CF|nr:VapE domain-containing protein [Elizabethkingia meningoseptica]OPC31975.1 virulence-associated e family protein [Elizabethkingia meningoseptica]